jgi:predicted RNase H-like nuclease (RuvC/YqgF family)
MKLLGNALVRQGIIGFVLLAILFFAGRFVVGTFWAGFESKFVQPRVEEQTAPLREQISNYRRDSAAFVVSVNSLREENASLRDTLAEVRTEQLKTVQSLQSIIKQVEDRRKAENTQKELRIEFLESLVKELEKGLPPKECYSVGLFGKIKLIDCPKD